MIEKITNCKLARSLPVGQIAKKFFNTLLFLTLCFNCKAETSAVFSDTNFVNYFHDSSSDNQLLFNYNRFRSNISTGKIVKNITLKAIIDLEALISKSFIKTDSFQTIKESDPNLPFNPYVNVLEEKSIFSRIYTYRLYSRYKNDKNNFTLGLQRVPFGVGRLWNPTDTFHPVNALSLEPSERAPVFAANLIHHLSDFSHLQLVANFLEKFAADKYGARFKANIKGIDTGLTFTINPSFTMTGLELESNLFDTGIEIRSETGYFDNNDLSINYINSIIGAEYAFPQNLTLLAEYFYNGIGKKSKTRYVPQILVNGNWNYSRHYLGSTLSYQLAPLAVFSFTIIINLLDKSLSTSPAIAYSLNNESSLNFGANLFSGGQDSEFNRYHDNLYYLRLETYF